MEVVVIVELPDFVVTVETPCTVPWKLPVILTCMPALLLPAAENEAMTWSPLTKVLPCEPEPRLPVVFISPRLPS